MLKKVQTLEEGRAVLNNMWADGIKPDVITYTTLLNKVQTVRRRSCHS
ncbi:hypothetical protein [Nitrosomonas communis]